MIRIVRIAKVQSPLHITGGREQGPRNKNGTGQPGQGGQCLVNKLL